MWPTSDSVVNALSFMRLQGVSLSLCGSHGFLHVYSFSFLFPFRLSALSAAGSGGGGSGRKCSGLLPFLTNDATKIIKSCNTPPFSKKLAEKHEKRVNRCSVEGNKEPTFKIEVQDVSILSPGCPRFLGA